VVDQGLTGQGWLRAHTIWESIRSLRTFGRQSLLALLGITVGCASVIALLNIGHNAANESISTFKGLGSNILVATFPTGGIGIGRSAPAQLDAVSLGAALPMIELVAPLTLHSVRIQNHGMVAEAVIAGTTSNLPTLIGLEIEEGRSLSNFDRNTSFAVVGNQIARDLGGPGRTLKVGDLLPIDSYLFEVVGIAKGLTPNPFIPVSADNSIFVPIEGMRRLLPNPEVGSVIARTFDAAQLNSGAVALKAQLEALPKVEQVDVQVPQQLLDGLTRQARTFSYLLAGLGGISLLVGGVGVMNVMLMSVTERRREIGLRMAIGARASDIRDLFLIEAATLSGAGAILGAFIGLLAGYAFVRISGWSFSLSPESLPLGIISSLAVGLFFGLYPAVSASRLQPVQALRDD